ncbi:patatin-like phospholipase family protein [Caldimonas tepidiphila]|uniref:patatin-like phospholipase family protein n=1 Tax=Caldimonas tepidiphila TaxID=2315841 RepID=UPI000E5AE17B|nr:patatin-like phospholipase family protein [Caldimonas tepidiphila]
MNFRAWPSRSAAPASSIPSVGRRTAARWCLLTAAAVLAGCTSVPLPPARPVEPAGPLPSVKVPAKPPRIGLALGGGAARGFAHIGVIQVLEENGIRPDLVVGTSAGSLVAALYASGKTPTELAGLADTMDETAITDWSFPMRGVIRGEALARYVSQQTGGKPIEQMRLPLGIVATDLASGQGVLFQRGDTGSAVRASSAVPAVFQPVRVGGREYVDGGLVAPVPVRYARQMGADLVIAVDISSAPDGNAVGDAMRMLLQTFAIMGNSINQFELREADVVIRPKLAGVSGADFSARKRSIQAGREAAQQALAELRTRLAARESGTAAR